MAQWSEDGRFYDASIVSMHGDGRTCTVKFANYDTEETQQLLLLIPRDKPGRSQRSKQSQTNVSFQVLIGLLL
jgi:Survival motor neuron protein (SMN)